MCWFWGMSIDLTLLVSWWFQVFFTGEELAQMLLDSLGNRGISIIDCRGQGYDNGANMAGKCQEVQARSLNALHFPPVLHTHFFGESNYLYVLFSASPECWEMLQGILGCSLHRPSDTRWSARIEAVRPTAKHLPRVIQALEALYKSDRRHRV